MIDILIFQYIFTTQNNLLIDDKRNMRIKFTQIKLKKEFRLWVD